MRDLTRLASRIVMFFMQFYYRLARHSRVSYKAYIDGRTRLAGYNTIQDNVLLAGARIGRGTYICRGYLLTRLFSLPTGNRGFRLSGKNGMRTVGISIGNDE